MARQHPGQPPYEDPNLFTGGEISAGDSDPAKRGFWLSLFLAQPLLMVGGMWMLLVLIAVIAFGGLLNPEIKPLPRMNPLEQARLSRIQRSASTEADQERQLSHLAENELRSTDDPKVADSLLVDANEENNDSGPSIPVWSLATLALICASGCWVIDKVLNAPPSAPVKKLRQPQPVKSNGLTPRTLKLKPYLASTPSSSQPEGKMQRLPGQTPNAHPTASPPPDSDSVVPSVVPPTEVSSLDWPDGSLAHQLDLRQQKSLSSWL
ncbi:MAG: hypothetical protein QNJ46_14815 [Leptolyngbyaceae cyanobacterium MO_188.B28]|nr:hypothetical protein [Leptolyngbyaceae cyanobacterium MO_188.B28]